MRELVPGFCERDRAQAGEVKQQVLINGLIMRFRIYLLRGLCLLTGVAATHRTYLPAIGPAPLRFFAAKPASNVYLLPPLEMPAMSATNEAVQTTSPAAAKTKGIEPMTSSEGQTLHASTNTTTEVPQLLISEPLLSIPDTSTNELSMQALVQFFKHGQGGTNQIDTSVIFPLNFVPPRPVAPLSSAATYSSP
jgi:hypothetical protein